MEILIYQKEVDLFDDLADFYVQQIKKNPFIVLGLATGSTPLPLYDRLIKANAGGKLSFNNVTTINLDEYVGLTSDNSQSYRYFMNTNLFDKIDIKKKNTFVPNGLGRLSDNAFLYNQLIDTKKIDIQLLGLGSNGHIAFNEPGTSFESLTHVVNLSASTIGDNARFFTSLDEVPTRAITMGIKTILKAKQIVLLAPQSNKSEAVRRLCEEEISINLPASALRNKKEVTICLTEKSAISLDLNKSIYTFKEETDKYKKYSL
ncbi:MAG: glucosamine-6-phosphate deaminase [Bacillales bacterium]|jgi:glucosamine-6-phosphate deaminase|nr:glucosamine-6-phosphate deaminase [Bacillales bacterium]